jgi:hypothetical protein
MTTDAPEDKPTKKLTMRLIRTMSDPPTAASAVFPTNCPRTTASTAEYSCCSSVPSMIGRKKASMPCKTGPSVMELSRNSVCFI